MKRKSDGSEEKTEIFKGNTNQIFNTRENNNNNPEVLEDAFYNIKMK